VDVLEHTVGVVRRPHAKVPLEPVVPCGRQVVHCQVAMHDGAFEIEPEQHVQVVGDLVGLDPNE
jgi:hypothetical protein